MKTRSLVVLAAFLLLAVGALSAPYLFPGPTLALQKGIIDSRLERECSPSERAAIIQQIGTSLGARWVRLIVDWSLLEPTCGAYSPAYTARLDALVDALRSAKIKVILTTCYLPTWAQEQYWWGHPPPGCAKGPMPFYPIRKGALSDYADLGQFLATHFAGRVQALECWNEPNLWCYIYPQRTADDGYFAARVYLRMLRAFHAGVSRAHTGVRVVAGATASLGPNDRCHTSPQAFAAFLKRSGAADSFDVYSHHPYTPGCSSNRAPDQPPDDPGSTVTLGNLRTLLRLFPGKEFYLTEYGYNTHDSVAFGWLSVSPRVQASYLKRAYAVAGRHSQVKVLLWFLLWDYRPATGPAEYGVYTGLREASGERKPAWYAFRAVGR